MRMNNALILAGKTPDLVGSMVRGQRAGRENALNQLYKTQGAEIAAGDQAALNALAAYDPQAAMEVTDTMRTREMQDERMQFARNADSRAAQGAQRQQSLFEKQEHLQKVQQRTEKAVGLLMQASTPQEFDQLARMHDPELVGQFGNRQAIARSLMSNLEKLQFDLAQEQAAQPDYKNISGQIVDMNNPTGGVVEVPGLEQAGPQTVVNVGGDSDDFYKELDKGQAGMIQGLISSGMTVPARRAQIDELERALAAAPSGAEAAIKFAAGNLGLPTEGLSDLQAAQSIINRLVPAQREPGSGPMSDRDLEIFKQSLPRLINTPEGNRKIVATMRGLIEYEAKQAEVANRVASRQITPSEALKELSNLENPLANQPKAPAQESQAMTFETFSADQSAKAAAEKYGVTLEEMWAVKQRGQ